MKFALLCLCAVFLCKASAQKVFVETKLSNTIYYGIDNPVIVWVEGYNPRELNYSVDVGEIISKKDSGKFVWRVCTNIVTTATLKVSHKQKLVAEIIFVVKKIPSPTVRIPENNHHSSFSKIIWQGIRADVMDFVFEGISCEIMSYDISIAFNETKDTVKIKNKGAFLNKENIPYFNKLKPGDSVFVYNVEVKVGCIAEVYMIKEIFKRAIY
jgi:GldM C-terminal domain